MNEISSSSPPPRQSTASPPPKCAICLGTCNNKCFSDSCRHQFCFTCLLEWSKVKAECPLCKQRFKSIIYNIKSNDEYDEHVIVNNNPTSAGIRDLFDDYRHIPASPSPSRHFQFRTTFTVDPGGEFAIQQMLLSHPLVYNIHGNYVFPRQSRFGRLRHVRRASSSTSFRRSIYTANLWVYSPPDVTGRYREVAPHFFRENPAARNRLVPWLNRELNALLRENTQQVMHLVDVIMKYLTRWHIRSRSFKRLLEIYLTNNIDHFIHEFYNFMRSPYDMIGYDRHVIYSDRPHSPTLLISDDADDDSDVAIVNTPEPVTENNNPFRQPTIEVIEINSDSSHDSDVIIGETPVPEVVLIDSDSNEAGRTSEPPHNISDDSDDTEINRKTVLPLKIRLKRKRQSREKRSRNKKRCCKRYRSSSSFSSSSSTDDSTTDSSSSSEDSSPKRCKRKHKYKKIKTKNEKDSKLRVKEKLKKAMQTIESESSSSDSDRAVIRKQRVIFDSDDSIPLSEIKHKEMKKLKSKKSHTESSKSYTITSSSNPIDHNLQVTSNEDQSKPSCSRWKPVKIGNSNTYDKLICQVPPGTASSSKILSTVSNTSEDNSFSQSEPNSFLHSSMSHFDSSARYDPFSHYPLFGSTVNHYNISPVSVGSRYYDGPDYSIPKSSDSYTPPLALGNSSEHSYCSYNNLLYGSDFHCENLHREYNCTDNKLFPCYNPQTIEPPSRVNVGVGTSPIHNGTNFTTNESYCIPHCSYSSSRLQSVIVKKEDKDKSSTPYFLNALSSDSDV